MAPGIDLVAIPMRDSIDRKFPPVGGSGMIRGAIIIIVRFLLGRRVARLVLPTFRFMPAPFLGRPGRRRRLLHPAPILAFNFIAFVTAYAATLSPNDESDALTRSQALSASTRSALFLSAVSLVLL